MIAALAVAGIAGPVIFVVVVIVQSLLHPDYSHMALPISALAAWPGGWVQNVNFVVFGLLMIAYAIGLHFGVRPSRAGVESWAEGPATHRECRVGRHVVDLTLRRRQRCAIRGSALIVRSRRGRRAASDPAGQIHRPHWGPSNVRRRGVLERRG